MFNLELIATEGFSTLNVSMIPLEHHTKSLNKSVFNLISKFATFAKWHDQMNDAPYKQSAISHDV